MKISVITVTYNSVSTVEETIRSVIQQDHEDLEYIIIDGGSTDGTLDVVNRYKEKISKIISEKDDGLYYAINKGISIAGGDVIGILHSDDIYTDSTVLSDIDRFFKKGFDSVYGDLQYVKREDPSRVIRYWKSGNYKPGIFLSGWMPPHPAFFMTKSCYERFGTFDTRLKSAADYELMLRMLHRHNISTSYLPRVLVKMRVGGKSNASFANRIKANKEDRMAWKINGLKPGRFTLLFKPLSKLRQFLK